MATYGDYADIGYGVEVSFGSDTFYVRDEVDGPNEETNSVDATHSKVPGRRRRKIPGLIDPGTLRMTMLFDPRVGEAISDLVGTTDDLTITWPVRPDEDNPDTCECSATLMRVGRRMPVDDVMTMEIEFDITGELTWTAGGVDP